METAKGSSGSPICIINNNKLKLLAIHNSTDEYERSTYNEGVLFGPILKEINSENKQAIPINVRTDYNDVLNVIKNISDIFESLLKREKEKRNDFSKNKQTEIFQYTKFLKIKDYEEIKIYHRQILEEFKNRNKERFNAYFNRLNNHILSHAHNELGEAMNNILTILNDFQDIKSTFEMIKTFNNDIIDSFNKILISKDYDLKVKLIYFISIYIQSLSEMNCRYNNTNITLYKRAVMIESDLKDLKDIIGNNKNEKDENEKNEKDKSEKDKNEKDKNEKKRIVIFKYFIDDLIPNTISNYLNKLYYDLKMSFKIGLSKTMKDFQNDDYDTSIYIELKGNYTNINCFQIPKWPGLVIVPFSAFKVDEVEMDKFNQKAKIKLTLLERDEILKEI